MKTRVCVVTFLAILACAGLSAEDQPLSLSSPGAPSSTVDAKGMLHEDWGEAGLCLAIDDPHVTVEQTRGTTGAPTAVTIKTATSLRLTEQVFRAPIWPTGVDVLHAEIENLSAQPLDAPLELVLPEGVSVGDAMCRSGFRVIAALPDAPRAKQEPRPWGGNGTAALPDLGKPVGDCDAGFRNIRAGIGNVPIRYEFSVEPGAARAVVLGFCESHWQETGRRPVVVDVEGAPRATLDPIARWGQHVPGCLRFEASDTNHDGRLAVKVSPSEGAPDRIPILNVVWVFATDAATEMDQVLSGSLNDTAEYYVDAGGEADQDLYEGGKVRYAVPLQPGEKRSLLFLLAPPGTQSLPDPRKMAWDLESLRKAADDVWRDRPETE